MKLYLMITFAVVGTTFAIFPTIPEYVEESVAEDDGTISTTLASEVVKEETNQKDHVDQLHVTDDLTSESQTLTTFGRQSRRASLIPVYLVKSTRNQEAGKTSSNLETVKNPVAAEETSRTQEEFKNFGPYGPIFVRKFENPSGQVLGSQQIALPMYGSLRPIYNAPKRPGFMRPSYGIRPNYGVRPNYQVRPSYGVRPNDGYDAHTYESYGHDYERDFYGVGYDD